MHAYRIFGGILGSVDSLSLFQHGVGEMSIYLHDEQGTDIKSQMYRY